MADDAVLAVGVGASDDSPGEPALVIYVDAGKERPPIPAVIDGVRTKVVEGDRFRTFSWGKQTKPQASCSKRGVSAKHSRLNH